MAFFRPKRPTANSPETQAALNQILNRSLQHPPGTLERQQALTSLLICMQATGILLPGNPPEGDRDQQAERLQDALRDLCQNPETYTDGILERLQHHWPDEDSE